MTKLKRDTSSNKLLENKVYYNIIRAIEDICNELRS